VELLTTEFFSALVAIVIIDLVLAGDNAIVIALAARSLPQRLQKRAIIWGTFGAIAVRSLLTVIVVWLLKVPGLLLIGGLLLIWIGYRLLLPEESDSEDGQRSGASTFWGAIRTVVIADAIMGLDNVLGVAGAAHGSYLLVVMGFLISVPIVIWGSALVLRVVDRAPALVYVGAGVISWTAAKMITTEPYLQKWFAEYPLATALLYGSVVFGVLWGGFVKNHHRLESRIHARMAQFARRIETETKASSPNEGEATMLRVLIPVDGSRNAENAVRHVIREHMKSSEVEIHLLNVQPRFSRHIAQFVSKSNRYAYHREQAQKALQSVRGILDRAAVSYHTHMGVGERAKTITDMARGLRCDRIIMGTARKNSLTRMLEDSVTNKVLVMTKIPVEVVPGGDISKLERYGIPAAGIGIAMGLLLVALE
jgi:YjbE family integral membrane protein